MCTILGGHISETVDEGGDQHIVLISDTVDDDIFECEDFLKLAERNIIPPHRSLNNNPRSKECHSSTIKFVYYSWVADSIAANFVAPFEPYMLGFVQ